MKPLDNKKIALKFQELIVAGEVQEAYERYVHPDFRHHNPNFYGDRESLLQAMEENAQQFPQKVFEVKHILEDGGLVAIHSKLILNEKMPEMAVVHIFRFQDNQIIELWDIGQAKPEQILNKNGLF